MQAALKFSDHPVRLSGDKADLAKISGLAGLSCHQDSAGTHFEVAKDTSLPTIIHLVHHEAAQPIHFVLGQNSRVILVESFESANADNAPEAKLNVVIKNGAQLNYTRIQNQLATTLHHGTTNIVQERDSQFDAVLLNFGASLSRHELNIALTGPGTNSRFFGLSIGNDEQKIETHTFLDHQQPHGTSEQVFKTILGGNAKGVFEGRIDVRKEAQKTDARQTNKTLLLSPGARIDTTPQLNIHADDVKCSHGAAVGQLNPEEVFYLEARAISRAIAQQMMTLGFAEDILYHQNQERILAHLHQVVVQKLATLKVEL